MSTPSAPESNPCFVESRRLTGHNRFFAGTGAVLEPLGSTAKDAAAHARWRDSVIALRAALGWSESPVVVRHHAGGTLLALSAPPDLLFTATEINEWAWEQASGEFALADERAVKPAFDQLHPLGPDFKTVVAAFAARAAAEFNPPLAALRVAARLHNVPMFADDETVSIGAGAGSHMWPLTALPDVDDVPWPMLHDVPTALVTGSNGKTTTVRLLVAMIAAGNEKYKNRVGYASTEGVVTGGENVGDGDFSGPAGARVVLRDKRVEAAVLETARGGILRRGLAVERADVAVVTNISADHFGEYGIDNLEDLADVKLVTASALGGGGTLVLNADDPMLLSRSAAQACKVSLFAREDGNPALDTLRKKGGATCGLVGKQLWLTHHGIRTSLGMLDDMPLTFHGAAIYNIANISAAVLAAVALGISPAAIAGELKKFGSSRHDNAGRLAHWSLGDVTVLVDYAHNPGGLAMLLAASRSVLSTQDLRRSARGRLGLLLGQAGNRSDHAIAEIASTAASFAPDLIVLKEITSMLRGRSVGEVPALLKAALLAAGYPEPCIDAQTDELDAARVLLRWARPGDVLVLPIHQMQVRKELAAMLDRLERRQPIAGSPQPLDQLVNLGIRL